MGVLDRIEAEGVAVLDQIEHAAAWLVGKVATADEALHRLEAASPLIAEAIAAGERAAAAHGVPVAAIENAAELVLDLAKKLAARLQATSEPAGSA